MRRGPVFCRGLDKADHPNDEDRGFFAQLRDGQYLSIDTGQNIFENEVP
jgi:hypothetical protein